MANRKTHVIFNDYISCCGKDLLTLHRDQFVSYKYVGAITCKLCKAYVKTLPAAVLMRERKKITTFEQSADFTS